MCKEIEKKAYYNALHGKVDPNPCEDVEAMLKKFEILSREKLSGAPEESAIIRIFTIMACGCTEAVNRGVEDRATYDKAVRAKHS